MSENGYQKLMNGIHTPAGLNDRVLAAARQQTAEKTERPLSRRARPVLRGAVCAACALALVLGTVTLRPAGPVPDGAGSAGDGTAALVPALSFGLTAYAADTGETVLPNANGGLAFTAGDGMANPETGDFTGCLFRVTGENIRTVSLSIDRGALYRYILHTDMTDREIAAARKSMAEGTLTPAAISQNEDGAWYMPEMTALDNTVTEDYDPTVSYGFWVPPEEMIVDETMDLREESWANIDLFDGAALSVTVTFADGSSQSKTYQLSTGRLKAVYEDDGTLTILPQLAGDDESCVYGVYAVDEAESRWLEWPVRGANTISMSNPYGGRWQPGGKEQVFHNGIDIPAERGTPILAAADGTVTEVGFNAERGNYLVLDHGNGLETMYAQCQSVEAEEGDTVKAGQTIAALGSTGMSTGPHLHFEVRQDGESQNPVAYFDSDIRNTLQLG